jgi:hypothetical protein
MKILSAILVSSVLNIYLISSSHASGLLGNGFAMQNNPANQSQVLAQSPYGNLTTDGVNAYIEALAFCQEQLGQPTQFTEAQKQQITQVLATSFPSMPPESQQGLANARMTWTQYRNNWQMLTLDQKKAFAYDVLALAYGDQAAAQALGMNQGSGYAGSGGSSSSSPGGWSEPCYQCTEEGSMTYGGAIDIGGGEFESNY